MTDLLKPADITSSGVWVPYLIQGQARNYKSHEIYIVEYEIKASINKPSPQDSDICNSSSTWNPRELFYRRQVHG